jgi:hypothetical protein
MHYPDPGGQMKGRIAEQELKTRRARREREARHHRYYGDEGEPEVSNCAECGSPCERVGCYKCGTSGKERRLLVFKKICTVCNGEGYRDSCPVCARRKYSYGQSRKKE